MIQPDNHKGIKEIDGEEMNAIMDADVVNHNELRIELHHYRNMEHRFNSITKTVVGYPMRQKFSHQSEGEIKYLLNDIVSYVDYSGIVRIVDLSEHKAFNHKTATVSVNNTICQWD